MLSFFKKNAGPPKIAPNEKWVIDNLKFYRTIGFFADLGKMSDKQLAAQIIKRLKPDAAATREFEGLAIAQVDTKRVWHHEPVDFTRDRNFFIRAIEGWASISRGILRPLKLTVQDSQETGDRTLIQFAQDSMLYSIYVSPDSDNWLDPGVLRQLNEIFADTGFRFEMAATAGDTRYVVVVTPSEKQKLIKERNWRFVD